MTEHKKKKNIDDDILRSREDIIRAQGKQKQPKKPEQNAAKRQQEQPSRPSISKAKKQDSTSKDKQTRQNKSEPNNPPSSKQTQQKSQIPQLDLTRQIMAEQRKITTARRKSPDENDKTTAQPKKLPGDEPVYEKLKSAKPYRSQIVSEIVSRDIVGLSRENK